MKNSVIEKVQNSVSSIFLKEDVIKLLLEQSNTQVSNDRKYSLEHLKQIKSAIIQQINNMDDSQICDEDDIELDMYDKTIRLDISVNKSSINEEITEAFEDTLSTIDDVLDAENEFVANED